MDISRKLVLVTGASTGIGAATAKAMASRGACVALLARTRPALEQAASDATAAGGQAHVYSVDLSDAEAAGRTAETIKSELGTPDILINNAGAGRWLFLDETDPVEAVQMMAVPYLAAIYMTRAFLPEMLARHSGMIVNVTSPAAYAAWPGATAYTAARWAMRGLTKALQADLRATGVNVMLFVPGLVKSTYWEHNPGAASRIPRMARLYRSLTPEETAEALARAVEHDRREVIIPFALRLAVLADRILPGPAEWLLARTGVQRKS